jgi:FkbM family methyltransferase
MQFGPLTLKKCKYGWMLFSGPFIGKCFDLYGQYSESEVSMMRNFLREGSVAIDVGANIGDLTVPLAHMVGESGRVYAFESHPQSFNVLCANLALNALSNTKAINAFIATSPDADTKSDHWGEFAYVSEKWAPQFLAIDSLELMACDLIKVDVDGKELDVLRSGEMQIERFRPVLYFENDVRASSRDLLEYVMHKLQYDLYWHPAPIFEPENYFVNPVNHWAPRNIASLMVLAIPAEQRRAVPGLKKISSEDDWWDGLELAT